MENNNEDTREDWLGSSKGEIEQETDQDLFDGIEEPAEPEKDTAEENAVENEETKKETEPAKSQEEERELQEPPKEVKKWLLIGMVAICAIALIAFLFSDRFFNMIRGRSSYVLQEMEQTVAFSEGNTSVLISGDYLLRCNQDGLQALNEKGKVIWDVPFTMSSPYMLKAGSYVSVADRLGTSVLLVKDGVIESASWNGGYGNLVVVNHGNGVLTYYAHLSGYNCSVGQSVTQGDVIGYAGNTGYSFGAHLHFGIMINGSWVDPVLYLTRYTPSGKYIQHTDADGH
jgi:murein DD-endopeptidase MepM/ murein hydrolase activator NlpD